MSKLAELTTRAQNIFAQIVENYLATGQPIGSKQVAHLLDEALSPASIRSIMAQLEKQGLLYAPHVSAGRLPTQSGLRLFIDGLMQVGELSADERAIIAPDLMGGESLDHVLRRAVEGLSGLSACAGLVLAPNTARAMKHIEFMALSDEQILLIIVDDMNQVENRLMARPAGMTRAALQELGNYLNTYFSGRNLSQLRQELMVERHRLDAELGLLTAKLVDDGLISWGGASDTSLSNSDSFTKSLIVHGQNHLLDNVAAMEDLDRIRLLFDDLDRQEELIALLSDAEAGEGVKIFIGAETHLFSLSGSSLIISPYQDGTRKLVGVLGVIAPTRTNYARLIPMVDHTAKLVSAVLSQKP